MSSMVTLHVMKKEIYQHGGILCNWKRLMCIGRLWKINQALGLYHEVTIPYYFWLYANIEGRQSDHSVLVYCFVFQWDFVHHTFVWRYVFLIAAMEAYISSLSINPGHLQQLPWCPVLLLLGQITKNTSWSSGFFKKEEDEGLTIYYLLFFFKMAAKYFKSNRPPILQFESTANLFIPYYLLFTIFGQDGR